MITTDPVPVTPVGGVLTVPLEPGPCNVSWNWGRYSVDITVPDTDSDLWSLIAGAIGMPPGTTQAQIAAAVADYLTAHQSDLDEIDWYANFAAFPGTGITDQLYGARDTGDFYRWTGSAYVWASNRTTAAGITDSTATGRAVVTGTAATGRNALEALGLIQAAKNPDLLVTGAVTVDGSDLVTSAAVVWPDGSPGTLTITSRDANGAVLAYTVTYGSPVTKTYTQPTITRNANGAATNIPAIVVT